jgi:hypothetical protein
MSIIPCFGRMIMWGVTIFPLADYAPRASGLRWQRQCGVPTLVLITTVRQNNKKSYDRPNSLLLGEEQVLFTV